MKEQEAKFYLLNLPALEARLRAQGAMLEAPRVHEINLRFDTADGALTSARCALRLRQDSRARMTFKSPMLPGQAVSVREEIEFEVSDFDAARALLEALGYQVSVMYEKFRTTYHFMDTHVTLDELPYGSFAEVEGPGAAAIQSAALALNLDWDARTNESYLAIFSRLRQDLALSAQNLSFAELDGLKLKPGDLGILPADFSGTEL